MHSSAEGAGLTMLDAVVGAVIMVVATTSLLYSIQVAERAFDQAGRYPLNDEERRCCVALGLITKLRMCSDENIKNAPRAVRQDE